MAEDFYDCGASPYECCGESEVVAEKIRAIITRAEGATEANEGEKKL